MLATHVGNGGGVLRVGRLQQPLHSVFILCMLEGDPQLVHGAKDDHDGLLDVAPDVQNLLDPLPENRSVFIYEPRSGKMGFNACAERVFQISLCSLHSQIGTTLSAFMNCFV